MLRQHVWQPGSSDERHPTLALAATGGQEDPPLDDVPPLSADALPSSDDLLPQAAMATQGTRTSSATLATEYHSMPAPETVEVAKLLSSPSRE
jgi:hypothetical protein